MAEIRADAVSGRVDNDPLASGGTTLNSAGLADLPAVESGDFARLALFTEDAESGRVTDFEIVHVTDHTAEATSATISRGEEGTSGLEWPEGTVWRHVDTAAALLTTHTGVAFALHDDDPDVPRPLPAGTGMVIWKGTVEPDNADGDRDLVFLPEDEAFSPLDLDWHVVTWADELELVADDPVAQANDLSGNNRHLEQPSSSRRPIFREAVAAFNDRAAIEFDGVDDRLFVDFTELSQPNTIVLVVRSNLTGTGGAEDREYACDGTSGSERRHIVALNREGSGVRAMHAGSWVDGGENDTDAHLIIATFDGASSSLLVDNQVDASGNVGSRTLFGFAIGGAKQQDADYMDGEIAFAGVVDGTLTSQEKDDLWAWASAHYDIPESS